MPNRQTGYACIPRLQQQRQPVRQIKPISLLERQSTDAKLICTISELSLEKIKNEVSKLEAKLIQKGYSVNLKINKQEAMDPGASILVYTIDKDAIIGIDALFDEKRQKFNLDLDTFLNNNLGADDHLADMLVAPASLADGKTVFRVQNITKHLETNLFVTSKITGCRYGIGRLQKGFEVIIEGISDPSI